MKAVFVELPPFARFRRDYLDDDGFRGLQAMLMDNPEAGKVIEGTGGLRVICYFWPSGEQFWLFTIYDKNEADDLTTAERKAVKRLLDAELAARSE